ncbi:hypothetical protein Trydic_g19273 [Trypoxylus dichotomus]
MMTAAEMKTRRIIKAVSRRDQIIRSRNSRYSTVYESETTILEEPRDLPVDLARDDAKAGHLLLKRLNNIKKKQDQVSGKGKEEDFKTRLSNKPCL